MAKSHVHAAQLRQVLRLFSLFGHPSRVIIFQRLTRTPGTAGELALALVAVAPAIFGAVAASFSDLLSPVSGRGLWPFWVELRPCTTKPLAFSLDGR